MGLLTLAEIARRTGIRRNTIQKRATRQRWPVAKRGKNHQGQDAPFYDPLTLPDDIQEGLGIKHNLPTSSDFVVIGRPDYPASDEEILQEMVSAAARAESRRGSGELNIAFCADQPIGLVLVGDHHAGAQCWWSKMLDDAETIADTPGMYAALGGDGWDNYIRHISAMVNIHSTPGREYQAYRAYIKRFAHKILMVISGNHDAWTQAHAGVDLVRMLSDELRLVYSQDWQGVLNIHFLGDLEPSQDGSTLVRRPDVPHDEYRIRIQHKSRYNSSLNPIEHACRKTLKDHEADVIGLGHNHVGGIVAFEWQGQPRVGMRWCGYKRYDSWARKQQYASNWITTAPTVILYPGGKRMIPFQDIRDAAVFLTHERGGS